MRALSHYDFLFKVELRVNQDKNFQTCLQLSHGNEPRNLAIVFRWFKEF